MVTENNFQINPAEIDFDEPRLRFSLPVRSLVRVVSYSYYSLLTAAAVIAFFSDINWLKWLGALYLLFLVDFLAGARKAEHSLLELSNSKLSGINAASYLTPKSFGLIEEAFEKSSIFNSGFHLSLLKLLSKEEEIRGALWRLDVSPEEFEQKVDEEIKKWQGSGESEGLPAEVEKFAKEAFLFALSSRSRFVKPADLFGALGSVKDKSSSKIFYLFSINPADLQNVLIFSRFRKKYLKKSFLPSALGGFALRLYKPGRKIWHWAWLGRHSPVLDKFGEDLTSAAAADEIGFLIGHHKEYEKLLEIILRPQKNNALLIGSPHSGRSTIVFHLAFEIYKNRQPFLADRDIVRLKAGDLLASDNPLALAGKIGEEIRRAGNLILHFPDFEKLSANQDLFGIFYGLAKEGKLQIIGSAGPDFSDKNLLADGFDEVEVSQISEEEAVKVLSYASVILEAKAKIIVCFGAVKRAVELGQKLGPLPFAARFLLEEAAALIISSGGRLLDAGAVDSVYEKIPATKRPRFEV